MYVNEAENYSEIKYIFLKGNAKKFLVIERIFIVTKLRGKAKNLN